ncbi:MAG: DUF1800 domain-containing protein [Rhodothermales bacterium]|nr:DUF1800 domain-containing protein [Rhodothermales bacterium]
MAPAARKGASLSQATQVLDKAGARHLLRRAGFGAAPDAIAPLVGLTGVEAASRLVDEAVASTGMEEPDWANTQPPHQYASEAAFEEFFSLNEAWWLELAGNITESQVQGGLLERLTVFWHDHFVTSFDSYFISAFAWRYWKTLETHALGNFRDFVRTMGLQPAMLYYLDGYLNEKAAPNENYARELLELFTMGPRDSAGNVNYTEEDIAQIARALTGWTVDWHRLDVYFNRFLHDTGEKTFLGRTGEFDYDQVVDIVFETRGPQIAEFICAKLYREFVHEVPDPGVIAELADTMVQSDFELEPVIRQLLTSSQLQDEALRGAQIKMPVQLMVGMVTELGIPLDEDLRLGLYWGPAELNQWILFPPNVAGWPGYRDWINTNTLPLRWDFGGWFIYHNQEMTDDAVRAFATALHDPNDAAAPFKLAVAIAEHVMPVPLEQAHITDGGNPQFAGDLVNNPIPQEVLDWPEYRQVVARRFLTGFPWYEWVLQRQEAPQLIRYFLYNLVRQPEYQLT